LSAWESRPVAVCPSRPTRRHGVLVEGFEVVAGLVSRRAEAGGDDVERFLSAVGEAGAHELTDRRGGHGQVLIERLGQGERLGRDGLESALCLRDVADVLVDALDAEVDRLDRVAPRVLVDGGGDLGKLGSLGRADPELCGELVAGRLRVEVRHDADTERGGEPCADAGGRGGEPLAELGHLTGCPVAGNEVEHQ
jgi:hypothetical protein